MGGMTFEYLAKIYRQCAATTLRYPGTVDLCAVADSKRNEHDFINVHFYFLGAPTSQGRAAICEGTAGIDCDGNLCSGVGWSVLGHHSLPTNDCHVVVAGN